MVNPNIMLRYIGVYLMSDKDIIDEAKERFAQSRDYWCGQREAMREDLEFCDPVNPKQWPDDVLRARQNVETGSRPCLTLDRTNQYIFQVVNDARQNRPQIKLRPVDDNADVRASEVLQGLIRQVEYQSRAQIAYDTSIDSSARCGIGYFRLVTEIENEATNQQCLKIKRIPNVFSVDPDPDSTEPDGSDMMWCIISEDIPKKAFEKRYPKTEISNFFNDGDGWVTENTVRIAEYFRIVETKTNVLVSPQGNVYTEDEYWQAWQSQRELTEPVEMRSTQKTQRKCEWIKMTGADILEKTEFPSEYIPVFPVIGTESFVSGKRRLGGMVSRAKDQQRSYNYERSSFVERIALAPKAPYLAAVEAIAGYEQSWEMANRANKSYLPYNARGQDGQPLPTPQRVDPATIETGWAAASQQSLADLQSAFGMFEANLGQKSNETSGKAILARQREGDTANFHYIDNQALAIAQCGRVMLQAIPRIYDTARVVRILGEDEQSKFIRIDPNMPTSYAETKAGEIYINPNIGKYDIAVTVGPSYTTRRQESAEAISQLVNGNPQMMGVLGDEWVKLMDWPNADKLSKRLKALLPPELRQDEEKNGESPEVLAVKQEAQQMIEKLTQELQSMQDTAQQLAQELEKAKEEDDLKEKEILIKGYEAETDRLKVVQPQMNPEAIAALAAQLVIQAMQTPSPTSIDEEPYLPREDGMIMES